LIKISIENYFPAQKLFGKKYFLFFGVILFLFSKNRNLSGQQIVEKFRMDTNDA